MYESPITQILGEMTTKYEDDCLKVVQSYGFTVNKEELTKALQYDRGQYTKGYNDGYTKAIEEFAEQFIYTAICEGCSGCANCYETGSQYRCDHYRYYTQIAEQLKGNKAAEEKEG